METTKEIVTDKEKIEACQSIRDHMGSGPENKVKFGMSKVVCTAAVYKSMDIMESHWFLGILDSYQFLLTKEERQFLIWELEVLKDRKTNDKPVEPGAHTIEETADCDWRVKVTGKTDLDQAPCVEQRLEFTNHPVGKWKFYQEWDCILLPEER